MILSLAFSLGVAFAVGWLAERLGWLRPKSAWAAAWVGGLPLWAGGIPAALAVILLAALGSTASRLNPRSRDQKGRTALQVLANGLPAALGIALGAPLFFLGAIATAAADTLATEVGARSSTAWHPLKGPVSSGTNAAISLPGTLGLVVGAMIFGLFGLALGQPVWPIALGGIAGAFADTLLGLLEDRLEGWSNDLTNLLATTLGGFFALGLGREILC
ncbi:DUF92 domain-containing protein [Meiothermus sp. PNK-Is4]|nr:DUF92 domain-containing protein [Meiothermus sp. Pnk-1]RYM32027.1 DUF92 domain-containing protein [Meiothermus sp. PNK-Is4]